MGTVAEAGTFAAPLATEAATRERWCAAAATEVPPTTVEGDCRSPEAGVLTDDCVKWHQKLVLQKLLEVSAYDKKSTIWPPEASAHAKQ